MLDSEIYSNLATLYQTLASKAKLREASADAFLERAFPPIAEDGALSELDANDTERPPRPDLSEVIDKVIEKHGHILKGLADYDSAGPDDDDENPETDAAAEIRAIADGMYADGLTTDSAAPVHMDDHLSVEALSLLRISGAKLTAGEIAKRLNSDDVKPVSKALARLIDGGFVSSEGERRGKRYFAVNTEFQAAE